MELNAFRIDVIKTYAKYVEEYLESFRKISLKDTKKQTKILHPSLILPISSAFKSHIFKNQIKKKIHLSFNGLKDCQNFSQIIDEILEQSTHSFDRSSFQ